MQVWIVGEVKVMKKVILYGLGGITKEKEKMIKNINIVGYSDSFANLDSFDGKMFIKKDQLTTAEFDYILIMPERSVSLLIKQELKQYIPEEKLVVFDELYNAQYLQKVDRLELKNTYIEGIILGISHAVTGINDIPGFINASVRGQDAYYNVKTFEFIEKKCALDYLNTVIIEIYDYNYLNYDVSLTRRVVDTFYSKGGLFEYSHNFDKNIHFESSLHDIMKTQVGLDYNKDLFLFYEKNNGFEAKKYTNVISNDAALPARKFTNRLVQDRYESTIIENKKY